MKIVARTAPLMAAAIITVSACSKRHAEVDNESRSAAENSMATAEYMGLAAAVYLEAARTVENSTTACGATVATQTPLALQVNPEIIQCVYKGDARRTGSVKIRFDGTPLAPGTRQVITMSDYAARGYQFAADSIVLLTKEYSAAGFVLGVNVHGARYGVTDAPGASQYQAECDVRASQEGNWTLQINGSTAGTAGNGVKYEANIVRTLVKKADCNFIGAGAYKHRPEGLKEREVEFGDGTGNATGCRNDFRYHVNGNSVTAETQ